MPSYQEEGTPQRVHHSGIELGYLVNAPDMVQLVC